MSDEDDEMGSNKELKKDESSSEFDSDSEEFVGSAETSDFPNDTGLELDSLGTIVLEGGTSSGGGVEGAVDVLQGDTVDP